MEHLNKQLTAWLMESYDQGVADTRAATEEVIEKAIAAAIAAEREACAQLCDDLWQEDGTAMQCRDAIRSRT